MSMGGIGLNYELYGRRSGVLRTGAQTSRARGRETLPLPLPLHRRDGGVVEWWPTLQPSNPPILQYSSLPAHTVATSGRALGVSGRIARFSPAGAPRPGTVGTLC